MKIEPQATPTKELECTSHQAKPDTTPIKLWTHEKMAGIPTQATRSGTSPTPLQARLPWAHTTKGETKHPGKIQKPNQINGTSNR